MIFQFRSLYFKSVYMSIFKFLGFYLYELLVEQECIKMQGLLTPKMSCAIFVYRN